MTEHDRGIIEHSLGISRPRRHSYRNHYCANLGSPARLDCLRLAGAGHMVEGRFINDGQGQMFHVTDRGAKAAGVFHKLRKEDRL